MIRTVMRDISYQINWTAIDNKKQMNDEINRQDRIVKNKNVQP